MSDLRKNNSLPTEMKIGDRTYQVLSFVKSEEVIDGYTMVERAKEMNAHLGADDCRYLLDHMEDIPHEFMRRVNFIFTDYRSGEGGWLVCWVVLYHYGLWVNRWFAIDGDYNCCFRVLRRKS